MYKKDDDDDTTTTTITTTTNNNNKELVWYISHGLKSSGLNFLIAFKCKSFDFVIE